MRLLTLLATTVLLAACVHDTDDYNLFVTESGASLTYYIGGEKSGGEEDPWNTINKGFGQETTHTGKTIHDDPWDTISEKFGTESVHTGKNGDDDPWTQIRNLFAKSDGEPADPWERIQENFALESVHGGKSDHDDPWSRIMSLFPLESVHSGKTNDRFFLGFDKSVAVFVSFNYEASQADRARVVEVRGNVLKLEFADGVVQYVIDAPATWMEGTQLITGFLDATSKKDRPFLGVRFWRTAKGGSWGPVSGNLASEVPTTWPQEYYASGASLLVGLPNGQKSHNDPWTRIGELSAKNNGDADDPWDVIGQSFPLESVYTKTGESHDDPWDTILDNFSVESVHTGKGKSHDDPWDTINENFSTESVHTGGGKAHDDPWNRINDNFSVEAVNSGKGEGSYFMGNPIVKMLFVSVGGEKGEEDPWNRINELLPTEKHGGMMLTLVEVRGEVGRFTTMDRRSIFAVKIPAGWEPGLVLRGETYLLESKKMLPLMGAVVWEVDRNLSLPKAN